ncbi:MAG: polysaccharide biosynthesis C-terminal domain-containing protein [Actinomycetota bacterium]|nr:polysaccharide biosynthesis C-terminal domain-containing protein [Actinomycetota bacterium]
MQQVEPSQIQSDSLKPALQRVVRGGALGMVGIITGAVLNLVLVYVVTQALGEDGTGVFFESIALFSILVTVACFGADTGFVRTVSRFQALNRANDLKRLLIVGGGPVVVISTLFALAIVVWAPQLVDLLIEGGGPEAVRNLRLLAPFIPLASVSWICLAAARGFGSMTPYVLLENVGKPLLRPGLAMGAIAAGFGAGAIAIAWALPVAIQLPISIFVVIMLVRRAQADAAAPEAHQPGRAIASEFWRFSLARGAASVFQVTIMWLDILLVAIFLGSSEAGIYAVVSRLTLAGKLTLEAIRLAIAPELSALLARGDNDGAGRLYRVAAIWTIVPSWPLYVLLFIFAHPVMEFFGPQFVEGVPALRILSAAMLFNLGTGEVTTLLLMGGKSSWNLFNNSISLAINLSLNLILIPRWGIEGAAVAWTLSILFDNIVPLIQIGVLMKIRLFGPAYFRAVATAIGSYAATGVVWLALLGASGAALILSAVTGSLVYIALLFRSRGEFQLPLLWEALKPGARRRSGLGPPPASENA